jgi:undecaprenyl diphosphate synthase
MNPQLLAKIDKTRLPRHVAIIMDGNGRWAKSRGLARIEGHRQGAETVDVITETARQAGVKYLTLYAFSQENWGRPPAEVSALMELLLTFLESKKQKMLDNGIRLGAIGNIAALPPAVRERLKATIDSTSVGREMVLTLALSYGARDEIVRAVRALATDVLEKRLPIDFIEEALLSKRLDTRDIPDPDLIIRTSGENRISNFSQSLIDYPERERRFGKTSEQLD